MRCAPAVLAIALLAVPPLANASHPAPPLALPPQGPDVPPSTRPVAVVTVFQDEVFTFTQDPRTQLVAVPAGPWDRVVLVFRDRPLGDPWDRLFGVAVGGVEVLRGTTPRADFTVRKDVTAFASLLPPGGTAEVALFVSTFVGSQLATVKLEFYDDPATAGLVEAPASKALPAWRWGYIFGQGQALGAPVQFPATAPRGAVVEVTLTGHSNEEFWLANPPHGPRAFRVLVDGNEVARVAALPYTYAFVGFGGTVGTILHPVMWWSAHQALDLAGVHGGVGEIPPYRAAVAEEHLALLSGARTVELVPENNGSYWVTSVSFLLQA